MPIVRASFRHGMMAIHSLDQFTCHKVERLRRVDVNEIDAFHACPAGWPWLTSQLDEPSGGGVSWTFAFRHRTNSVAADSCHPSNKTKMHDVLTPTADLLALRGEAQAALHARAAAVATDQFGRKVFVRAVVEVS